MIAQQLNQHIANSMYAAPHCISARAWTFKVPVSDAEIVKTAKMWMQDVFNNTTRNVLLRLMFYTSST